MTWTLYGEKLASAAFTDTPTIYQPFTLPDDTYVKAIRTMLVIFNSPTFATLRGKIFANQNGAPTTKLFTSSNSFGLSDLLETYDYGAKEIYFDFDTPVLLKGGTLYHFALGVGSDSFSDTQYLSWVKGYPDPNSDIVPTLDPVNLGILPFYFAAIGANRDLGR